ncbi:DUF4811 domain-containing protein [Latilactobacillus graminis]|uniref:DUF4811 domain-containing protein n=2 Tax=Latilactobacillus graminis TaxID=60519 RepID=A0AA89I9U3_9LACO|nr:DUF4811 domain-containing protein [Latilactobacillus graminis]KRM24427.1 hypothetical protein FC90_GL000568 [Latilactobacillus graminis DSM 20719]QFP80024.1 DUF4811 domain-containing protein [Latilactobacillus graminis]
MIIVTLVISTLALFFASIFGKKMWRPVLMLIFGLTFIASLVFIVQNDHNHYGMKTITETKTRPLVSSADAKGVSMLLYHPLGNGTEKIYLYRTATSQKKPQATQTKKTSNSVQKNAKQAALVTKTKYRVYQNQTAKFWFGISGNDHEFVSRHNTFKVAKGWLVLSDTQAKQLAKTLKKQQAQLKTGAITAGKQAVMTAMHTNPAMTAQQQQAVAKKAAVAYQQTAMAKVMATLK